MLISLDTETTGKDLYHGAVPFYVVVGREDGETTYWEWDVDPITREVDPTEDDLQTIAALLEENYLVLQNAKFDVTALNALDPSFGESWPWDRTHDTLTAGHLLASHLPHDLTWMAKQYLGHDISKHELILQDTVNECRREARSHFPEWRIAKADIPEIPSAKGDRLWPYDLWLPRALAKAQDLPEDHPWWTVLSEYANADAAITRALWDVMEGLIRNRGQWKIYEAMRRRSEVAYRMERRGVSASKERLLKVRKDCSEGSDLEGRRMTSIAKRKRYNLELPKGGCNNSLQKFMEAPEYLDLLERNKPEDSPGSPGFRKGEGNAKKVQKGGFWTPTGKLSTSKSNLKYMLAKEETRNQESIQSRFLRAILGKRRFDTSLIYLEGYERYWLPLDIWNDRGEQLWFLLHPNLNPTGTGTLRWSSNNPNEQNISKQEGVGLRSVFGPAPGREWWSLDAKNIELRLPAYESGERELIDLFERPDDPPYYGSTHLLNFHTVYPDLWEEELRAVGFEKVGPHCKKKYASTYYQWCKNGGFAVQYGAVDRDDGRGTADRAFGRPGSHAKLKARFSKLETLNQKYIRFAEEHGYVETMPDRTVDSKRGYPLYCTRTEFGRVKPTVPLNYHIQSTAMWWMSMAMIRVDNYFRSNPDLDAHIVMQVHDELVLDFPAGRGLKPWLTNLPAIRNVQRLMEVGGDNLIPQVVTPVGVEYHKVHWGEGRTL